MNLTTQEFKDKIFNFEEEKEWKFKGEKATVLKFSAIWCSPCVSYNPIFEEVTKETPDVDFYHVDVDAESELAQVFGVQSVPTTFFIPKDGGQPQAASGAIPKEKLNEVINEVLLKS
jgi:thiol-disulfide isomerase/thioredoxin